MKILIPVPDMDFDPTESSIPWKAMREAGHAVDFATPSGRPGAADPRMITGEGLGPWKGLLRADAGARAAYAEMERSPEFLKPLAYGAVHAADYGAILLPGGHAKGMRPYLESERLQSVVAEFFDGGKPVAAICHGTLLAARSRSPRTGKSVLHGRKTTGLRKDQELTAWALTCAWLGDYYRTYPTPMETELRTFLRAEEDFLAGPMAIRRDSPEDLRPGFTVRDGDYLSARWPGDVHRFAAEWVALLGSSGLPRAAGAGTTT